MKTTIELTPEQISQITKIESDLLLSAKNKAIDAIEKKYKDDCDKLVNKYKNFVIEIGETKQKKVKKIVTTSNDTTATTGSTETRGRKKKIITE